MYNNYTFNGSEFNQIPSTSFLLGDADISYGDYSLQNAKIIINKTTQDNGPITQSDTFYTPRNNGGGELNYFFREKTVTLDGYIKANSSDSLNSLIDEVKKNLGKNKQVLKIKVNGVVREAIATCVNLDTLFDRQHYNITFLPIKITFRIIGSFFADTIATSRTFLNRSTDLIDEIINGGTVVTNPILLFTINSGSTTTSTVFTTNNESVTINQSLSSGDVLIIDTNNKQVLYNGTSIDYDGVFPEFVVDSNSYTVTMNGTQAYDLTIYFYNNYL